MRSKRVSKMSEESFTSNDDFLSDDSENCLEKARMEKVCSQLDAV